MAYDPVLASMGIDSDGMLPVRMINEYSYCPRLFHLVHIEGRWADNEFTEDGKAQHRRVDRFADVLPEPSITDAAVKNATGQEEPPTISRSVSLGSATLGIVGKLDLVATTDDEAFPLETKRGKPPNNDERCHEPERIQLMAQGLLLREAGFRCERGAIYFAAARQRVVVPFTTELETRTRAVIAEARAAASSRNIPPPLVDDKKCWGCSLNGICLPDETALLQVVSEELDEEDTARSEQDGSDEAPEIRRLYPARSLARPFYVQEQGCRVGRKRGTLVITKEGVELAQTRARDVSHLVTFGNVSVTPQALHALLELGRPIVHLSFGGWFYGISQGMGLRNAYDRVAQFKVAEDEVASLKLAASFVQAKASNQRTLLRRNGGSEVSEALKLMARDLKAAKDPKDVASLLGYEGLLARHYFQSFSAMLRPPAGTLDFDFQGRNSRPPRDPINALLSFGYALLAKDCTVALLAVGLDPYWGFYHRPKHGKPALALDLMEEFRPLVVDSAVLTAVNTGMVTARNFSSTSQGCSMGPEGRKALIKAYEMRMAQLATHPIFKYRCSWRQMIALQAQLLARCLRGDIPEYRGVTMR